MARKLSSYVHVADEAGQMHTFGPADEVPDWAQEAITNPDVWAPDEASGDGDASDAEEGDGDDSQRGRGRRQR